MQELNQYIVIDQEIAGGVPVFKGTRVTIKTLFDYLEEALWKNFYAGTLLYHEARQKLLLNWLLKNFYRILQREDSA